MRYVESINVDTAPENLVRRCVIALMIAKQEPGGQKVPCSDQISFSVSFDLRVFFRGSVAMAEKRIDVLE